jgi:regulator of ribonuclease activity A
VTSPATTDLCDAHPEIQVCEPVFQAYGGRDAFCGPITTLKVFEDNSLVREAVQEPGEGRVLVVDGGGSLRCSLFGGNLAVAAAKNGWAGVVVHGCVRDVAELAAEPVGVRALATIPRKSKPGLHSGQAGLPVLFAGVVFREGEWLCADADGVVVLPEQPAAE